MKRLLMIIVFALTSRIIFSQNIVQGYVNDVVTGEKLIGCSILVVGTVHGVTTNEFGFFSMNLPQMPAEIVFSYLGYTNDTVLINTHSGDLLVALHPLPEQLLGVTINGTDNNLQFARTGVITIPISQIKLLPSMGGETDVLKAFQLMPGVQGGNEGTSGLYVRGGTPDQNLVLLDDVPLYFVNHIGGFISVFDAGAINDVKLIKGGFPARYGGRLSSVIDVRMKSGDADTLRGELGVGIIASRLLLNGPVKGKNNRFMLSVRRSNSDLVTRPFTLLSSGNEYSAGYTFYDLYGKLMHEFNPGNSLSFSFYSGRDKIFINQHEKPEPSSNSVFNYKGRISWGNLLSSVKWNHQYNRKLYGSFTFAYTRFYYNNKVGYEQINTATRELLDKAGSSFQSGINDVIIRKDLDFYMSNSVNFRTGISCTFHQFNPGLNMSQNTDAIKPLESGNLSSADFIVYTESDFRVSSKLNANAGLHYNIYSVQSQAFNSLQPRLTLNYMPKKDWALKTSYVYMQQNLHLLSNNGAGLPTDIWVPATIHTKPQYCHVLSTDLSYYQRRLGVEINTEVYYKTLSNQIEFSEGASFLGGANNWEDKIERNGAGKSFGAELLIQKKQGRFNGWLGYTLSYNFRKFQHINNGEWFPYKFDRRHVFTVVANYHYNKNVVFGIDFVINTGNSITLPDGRYPTVNTNYLNTITHNPFPELDYQLDNTYTYPGRNKSRMPVYHRLDASVRFVKAKAKGRREWNISIYNVYNHQNPYFVYMATDSSYNLHLYQICLFPIIPSVSYTRIF